MAYDTGMAPNQRTSYAEKSTEQLAALDELLRGQIQVMTHQRDMIQAEMRSRHGMPMPPAAMANRLTGVTLNYLSPPMAGGWTPDLDNLYARNARRYGLRMAAVIAGILLAAGLAVCIVAMI